MRSRIRRPWRWAARLAPAAGVALLLLVAAAGPSAQESADSGELAKKRSQIDQLGKERSQAERQLARIQASESELRSEIDQLSELVRTSLRRKEALEQRIVRQEEQNKQDAQAIKHLEGEIRAGERRIGQRLRRLYRMAKQGRSALLFQMARFQSFPKDSRYLAVLQSADRNAIAQYEELNRELADKKEQAEASLQRLVALRGELDDETRQLADREAYLRAAMSDMAKNRTLYRKYLDDVEHMMAGMEAAVSRLERESRANATVTAAAPARPRPPEELRGTLPPPVNGEVIAAFGAQDPRYDLKKRQRGIVLRVAANAEVAAVAAGRAVHAGPFRGYQSLVVLDHGQGLFSVYGHLEQLTIKRGDWVAQGKVLGRATYQPLDEAYDVYFEVRHNGRPDDPLRWIKPGRLRISPQAAGTDGADGNGNDGGK